MQKLIFQSNSHLISGIDEAEHRDRCAQVGLGYEEWYPLEMIWRDVAVIPRPQGPRNNKVGWKDAFRD